MNPWFNVDNKKIGLDYPTYFIADIAANHDGSLEKAIELIHLAAEAGADAVKFQHFEAGKIVSDVGFKELKGQQSHQKSWKKSVFDVYQDASLPRVWTEDLQKASKKANIHFFSAPYDFSAVELLNQAHVPAHKIGSGDITWTAILDKVGASKLPVFLATGASELDDVVRAVDVFKKYDIPLCLMQCNTNYTGDLENLKYINLNVLKTFSIMWPELVLGLSDHTPGHATTLGAIALGARAIEKHFTNNKTSEGPDHKFSMDFKDWKEMVDRSRELEYSLGSCVKRVAENEKETVILQRRCLRLKKNINAGSKILESDLEALRPAPREGVMPYDIEKIVGKILKHDKLQGQHITFFDLA